MPVNHWKTRGSTKASQPGAGKANIYTAPVLAVVKDNADPARMGRLMVFMSDNTLARDPDDSNNWVIVNYMSNFFGHVRPTSSSDDKDYGTFKRNPSSYGEWHAPPDIGTTVVCIFINGDINFGYYIGCVPESTLLHMVPAIGATFADEKEEAVFNNTDEGSTYGGAARLPVTNINVNNDAITSVADYITQPKPVHSYTASIMEQQGIIRDPIRGPISSSAQRETASRVGWGVSTPGRPIYEGGYTDEDIVKPENLTLKNSQNLRVISRRGGHSIVMDDGDIIGRDQLVRIRTAKGHQILMSDSGETLMILHSNGQSYVELGKEGTVDVYSTNSINLRTQGDLNLHADNNLNIHAAKDLNIHAENMNVTTQKSLKQSIGLNWITSALGLITAKTTGAMSLQATGIASFSSTALTFINGGILNLNTGKSPIIPLDPTPTPLTAHTDTLFDAQKGFVAAPGKLLSVTSRAPAHAPWAHAGQGVDLKIELGSSGTGGGGLSSALSSAVSAGLGAVNSPGKLVTALSSNTKDSISKSLNNTATTALVGLTGQKAASGPLASAINKGADVVRLGTEKVAAVGSFAQNPTQMANAGILKPGSDKLINSLVNSGANIDQAMTNTLFTGVPGAETLSNFTKNVDAQTKTVVNNLQRSQSILTNTGVITGNESAGQVAGVVFSGANSGIENTIAAVKTTANKTTVDQSVMNDIGSATASVQSAETTIGGMAGISQVVQAMSISPLLSTKPNELGQSVTNSAFSSITGSIPSFKPGEPVNLATGVSGQKVVANALANMSNQLTTDVASKLTPEAIKTAAVNSVNKFAGNSVLEATNIASGVINVPGGLPSISSFADKSLSSLNIPGAEQVSSIVKGSFTSAVNGITGNLAGLSDNLTSSVSGITNNLSGGLSGVTNNLTGSLTSGLTNSLSSIGAIAGAFSAISAVKSLFGGKGGVRMLSVAVNTTNRESVKSKTRSLLGDPGIPEPNFTGEISQQAVQSVANINAIRSTINTLNERIINLNIKILMIKQNEGREILIAERNAPAGDPEIKRRKTEIEANLRAAFAEREELTKEVENLKKSIA